MTTWQSVFQFFLWGWTAGFSFAAVMYFATFFASVRWTEFWTGTK